MNASDWIDVILLEYKKLQHIKYVLNTLKIWDQISIRRQILGSNFFSKIVSFSNDPHCQFFSGYSSRYEAQLAVFVESFSSSSGTHMGWKYSPSQAIFSETVYTVEDQIQGPG